MTVSILQPRKHSSFQKRYGITSDSARFLMGEGGKFVGDASEILQSAVFVVGSDGEMCWWGYGKKVNGVATTATARTAPDNNTPTHPSTNTRARSGLGRSQASPADTASHR